METLDFLGKKVHIQRQSFYRGMSLTIEPNGKLKVKVGQGTRPTRILSFLEAKKSWISKHLGKVALTQQQFPPKKFVEGELYPYCGYNYRLKFVSSKKTFVVFSGEELLFHSPKNGSREAGFAQLKEAYKTTASTLLEKKVNSFSQEMNLQPSGLSFRSQKSIWGSCSAKNRISLNWKLIVAPSWVMDYVVIHELAHIVHKDHSPQFWKLVESYTAKRKEAAHWLKENAFAGDFLTGASDLWPADDALL